MEAADGLGGVWHRVGAAQRMGGGYAVEDLCHCGAVPPRPGQVTLLPGDLITLARSSSSLTLGDSNYIASTRCSRSSSTERLESLASMPT